MPEALEKGLQKAFSKMRGMWVRSLDVFPLRVGMFNIGFRNAVGPKEIACGVCAVRFEAQMTICAGGKRLRGSNRNFSIPRGARRVTRSIQK